MKIYTYPEYSSCRWKKKYSSIDKANDAGKSQMYNSNYTIQLYIYRCNYCDNFHLTQQIAEYKVF